MAEASSETSTGLSRIPTFNIIGTPLRATSYSDFILECQRLTKLPKPVAIDFTNTHIVTMRRCDEDFRKLTSVAEFFVPDGMPLIWCLNWKGANLSDRVYGPTFMHQCLKNTPGSFKHYFLGGSQSCLDKLIDACPDLNLIGSRNGYFRPDEEPAIIEEINRLSPDYIWIGLGTPKQQDWIYRNKSKIRRGLLLAVGFAFDVNAGTKPDAPAWMQKRGLTWIYRLCSEPRRLAGRYVKYNSLFLYYLVRDSLFGANRREAVE